MNKLRQIWGDLRSSFWFMPSLLALIREYLFVSLFRACAESLASENASRLAAMQLNEARVNG